MRLLPAAPSVLVAVVTFSTLPCDALQKAYEYAYVRDKVTPSIIHAIPCETDYIPNVVEAENGAAGFEALKAQAVAARTYLYYRLNGDVAVYDGTQDQVYSNVWPPLARHYAAAATTEREILQYPTPTGWVTICGFYVSGAIPDATTGTAPFGVAEVPPDYDPHGTEHYVTFNYFNSGESIIQSSLGWRTSPPSRNPYNRGCKSQNGASFLCDHGWNYVDILRFYYGADIRLVMATTPDSGALAATKTLADFELDEGYFGHDPALAPQSRNLLFGPAGCTAERATGTAHAGQACQQIVLKRDPMATDEFFYRHVSGIGAMGIGTAVSNLSFEPVGSIGLWLRTETPGLQVCLALNDDFPSQRGMRRDVVADGQWRFYQWFLAIPGNWEAWADGDGRIGGLVSIDSIQLFGGSDATVYLDDVIYNPAGAPLPGDIDADGQVNVFDVFVIAESWNTQVGEALYNPAADLDGDGVINVFDIFVLAENWGP